MWWFWSQNTTICVVAWLPNYHYLCGGLFSKPPLFLWWFGGAKPTLFVWWADTILCGGLGSKQIIALCEVVGEASKSVFFVWWFLEASKSALFVW
jgi:hypothetical protein